MENRSLIVVTVSRWIKGFLLLYGIYIVLYGHITPGGGFSGGVIIACAFILLTLAEGRQNSSHTLNTATASVLDSLGALGFLGIAIGGMLAAGTFFKNCIATDPSSYFSLFSAGAIPLSNIAIGLKVGTSVFLVFVVLSALHVKVKDGEREMVERGSEE
jgi:multicomponent Na+:H+ antiporter subunit B